MREQRALTIITRIKPGPDHLKQLGAYLDTIGKDIEESQADHRRAQYIRFDEIATTCFASWIILDRDPHYQPTLAFECNYEGPLEDYLTELVKKAGPALHEITSH